MASLTAVVQGNARCCAPCSLECQAAAREDQCPASCRQYEGNPTCCREAYEDPCPATCRDNPTQESCSRHSNIPGCYIPIEVPVGACGDLPQCEEAAERGQCLNECWLE